MNDNATMDPIAKAEQMGRTTGAEVARRLVDKADRRPALRRVIARDLQSAITTRIRKHAIAGWSKAMGLAWTDAFMAAADPIIQEAFTAWEAEMEAPHVA